MINPIFTLNIFKDFCNTTINVTTFFIDLMFSFKKKNINCSKFCKMSWELTVE